MRLIQIMTHLMFLLYIFQNGAGLMAKTVTLAGPLCVSRESDHQRSSVSHEDLTLEAAVRPLLFLFFVMRAVIILKSYS